MFTQLEDFIFSENHLKEIINHAESNLYSLDNSKRFIHIRVDPGRNDLKKILKDRNYSKYNDWIGETLSIKAKINKISIKNNFKIADGNKIGPEKMAIAHSKAFNYTEIKTHCFKLLRDAPDYNKDLDLSIINSLKEVVAFANIWYDQDNRIGILEPVGVIPQYRKMGLGKAIVYEAINRVTELGALKVYVGSDDIFYKSLGFKQEYYKEVWGKYWNI